MEVTARAARRGDTPALAAASVDTSSKIAVDRRQLLGGLAAVPLAASIPAGRAAAARPAAAPIIDVVLAPGLTVLVQDAGETGVAAFESADGRRTVASDFERIRTAYLPASTFKIPHTLIALETGVVASLDEPLFKWDGTVRTLDGKPIDAWNRDQTLREAFRNSTIWVYQEVARKVGPERMTRLVTALDYGNRAVGEIDSFWLSGPLRISALEQIAFLGRLRAGALPVSARAQALTREAMVIETENTHVLSGKTGWAFDQKIGWFVGWIEANGASRLFALNLDVAGQKSLAARTALVKSAAHQLRVL
ncbi:penicillin-binding transpeptidase domain-containing protein [Hyphomicrobium sp.]|uniref:penicillin-binding transpeptidase domain-containing protein n=1 Tax=Hyphomicrobium sp. TaxID=82 RepID=UPI0025BF5EF4|nr:penicillin-binding transpeptidase domain-containing protein [Hyphomicrobium sp.]MCC7251002.1 class D beta-lactamase [Hyphomicrobium sp.]